ncbi:MAG: hypothetical protein JOZ72_09525 [Alphaproteobacteria bacterium]|nr:hypothetical protein [Alphaproteobacteria bacterium]
MAQDINSEPIIRPDGTDIERIDTAQKSNDGGSKVDEIGIAFQLSIRRRSFEDVKPVIAVLFGIAAAGVGVYHFVGWLIPVVAAAAT